MMRFLIHTIFFLLISQHLVAQRAADTWSGTASFYHSKFEGRRTASGQKFSNSLMTAASNYFKLGQILRVTNLSNGQSVIVMVNDRMAAGSKRLVDLTQTAARKLCFINQGICKVKIELADEEKQEVEVVEASPPDTVSMK